MKKFKKNFLLYIFAGAFLLLAIFLCVTFLPRSRSRITAEAATANYTKYEKFLSYTGSRYHYYADAYYLDYVNIENIDDMQITWQVTRNDGVSFRNLKVELSGTGISKTVEMKYEDLTNAGVRHVLFDKNDLCAQQSMLIGNSYYEKGEVINGWFNVTVSGEILKNASSSQNAHFAFYVDTKAPTAELKRGDFSLKNYDYVSTLEYPITCSWTEDNLEVTYNNAQYDVLKNGKSIVVTSEGYHEIILKDEAGNVSKYGFTVDNTAPGMRINGESLTIKHDWSTQGYCRYAYDFATNNDVTISYSDTNLKIVTIQKLDSPHDTSMGTIQEIACNNTSGRIELSEESHYIITIEDKVGHFIDISLDIDKTKPELSLNNIDCANGYSTFLNSEFTIAAKDNFFDSFRWEINLNEEGKRSYVGKDFTVGGEPENYGRWHFKVFDEAGNYTAVTVTYFFRKTFGNLEALKNSYFIPAYYEVGLSPKNYINYAGTYEFADYASALSFATQKEWICRVIELNGGKEWNYVTPNNENARQIYTDRAELDSVIDKYARANISERKIIGRSGAVLNNPTDTDGVTRDDALTRQLTELPPILSAYSAYNFILVPASFCFTMPKSIVEGNKSTLKVQFISDGISIRLGAVKTLAYGDKLSTVTDEQGWYLIEESDVCRNIEKYLVYLDFQQPQIHAEVVFGSGDSEVINFDKTYISENTETMRYISFDIKALSDNIDDYVMLTIDGRGLSSAQYVCGDKLPVLSFENGFYGAYSVTVYDRSLNVLEFIIYIAGADPTLTYTSLNNETSCTFTIHVNDIKNEIQDVRLYKVFYNGTRARLDTDSTGTVVCADNLVYKMTVGGKYVFEFSDLYGRNVSTTPIFYMKGLPIATFRGVKAGGITKNDVSITFDATCTVELTVLKNGDWVQTDLYTLSEGVNKNTANITAGRDTTAIYNVLLYVSNDRNLFTEYTFEIDALPPTVDVCTEGGGVVEPDTVTTQNFYLTWEESGYSIWYRRSGSVTDDTYIKGTIIKTAGTYKFTVLDSVRNELSFTITLDNSVDYTLTGTSYSILEDGSYITRGNFVFTVLEPWSLFEVESSNDISIGNGQKIDTDGTYIINVKDAYGNALGLKLIVDKLPPEPVIKTEGGRIISSGARINEAFIVSCEEDGVNIVYSSGGANVAYNGLLISAAGNYTFTLTDRIGNSVEVKIFIDKALAFTVNGTYVIDSDGNYVSRTWLSVSLSEEMSEFYILDDDGIEYGADKRVSAAGKYEVYLQDTSGNERTLLFVIDKTPPTIELIGVDNGIATDGAVTVKFMDFSEAYYSRNGGEKIAALNGTVLVNEGSYVITAFDLVGNVATKAFAIDKTVDVTPSVEFVNGQILNRGVSFSFAEEVTALLYSNGKESSYSRGEISDIGQYSLVVTDNYHNSKIFEWSIVGRKAREYVLPVGDYSIEITRDGQVYSADIQEDELRISETGKYEIVYRYGSVNWLLELEVDNIAPTVEIKNTGKTVEIFNPSKSDVTYALYRDGSQISFNFGSTAELKQKGSYRLVCTDDIGNTTEYVFELNYMSATTMVLIAVAVILTIAVVIALVIIRFRRKKY